MLQICKAVIAVNGSYIDESKLLNKSLFFYVTLNLAIEHIFQVIFIFNFRPNL